MLSRLLCPAVLAVALGLGGCASQQTRGRRDLSAIRTVAVSYAPVGSGDAGEPSVAGKIAGRAVRHGISIGLGSLNLGLFAGLVGDVADLSPSQKRGAKISQEVLTLLSASKSDPAWLVAQRMQGEITRRQIFSISRTNPDALFDFDLQQARLEPVDRLGLQQRALLSVKSRLRDRSGNIVWSGESVATSARARTWQEYRERPTLLKGDFDALARTLARDLVADLSR